jgi:hypothetical protein
MADRVLFISWGENVAGREQRGLEVFNEAVGLYGQMQQEGRIEGFDVVLLEPNTAIAGYMVLSGSAEQLAAVRDSDDFLRVMTRASTIVHELSMVDGYTGAGIARVMEIFQEAAGEVPQLA